MQKVALNFICKDESHVILKMLHSTKSILDLIVAVDTGSSDNTCDLIEGFGIENKIPTYVFKRPFDDFSGSRNYALQKLRDVARELEWNLHKVFVLWLDCDEKLIIQSVFKKTKLDKDTHTVPGTIDASPYVRDEFFRLSRNFFWYGPIHEKLSINEAITSTSTSGIKIVSEKTGNSWKGHLGEKNKRYGDILEYFIDHQDRSERWIFMTAQSYHAAGHYYESGEEKEMLLRKAIGYYSEVTNLPDASIETRYFSQFKVGCIMDLLAYPWLETMEALIKAYIIDPIRGESIKHIILHYTNLQDWKQAYIYTSFAMRTFLNSNPAHLRTNFVDHSFYNWEAAEFHRSVCAALNRKQEAEDANKELLKIIQRKPEYFNNASLEKIKAWKGVN